MRDLPDIALLATTGPIDGAQLRRAVETTFAFRSTHSVPASVHVPPDFWEAPYSAMAAADELPWKTLRTVTEAVSSFLNPVLQRSVIVRWDPGKWVWR